MFGQIGRGRRRLGEPRRIGRRPQFGRAEIEQFRHHRRQRDVALSLGFSCDRDIDSRRATVHGRATALAPDLTRSSHHSPIDEDVDCKSECPQGDLSAARQAFRVKKRQEIMLDEVARIRRRATALAKVIL